MVVLEKDACALADAKAKNKIKRYELRDQMEKHYFFKDVQADLKKKEILDKKYSYKRYQNIENRGFDIITINKIPQIQKENKNLKHNKSDWDKLCETSKGDLIKDEKAVNNSKSVLDGGNAFFTKRGEKFFIIYLTIIIIIILD